MNDEINATLDKIRKRYKKPFDVSPYIIAGLTVLVWVLLGIIGYRL